MKNSQKMALIVYNNFNIPAPQCQKTRTYTKLFLVGMFFSPILDRGTVRIYNSNVCGLDGRTIPCENRASPPPYGQGGCLLLSRFAAAMRNCYELSFGRKYHQLRAVGGGRLSVAAAGGVGVFRRGVAAVFHHGGAVHPDRRRAASGTGEKPKDARAGRLYGRGPELDRPVPDGSASLRAHRCAGQLRGRCV